MHGFKNSERKTNSNIASACKQHFNQKLRKLRLIKCNLRDYIQKPFNNSFLHPHCLTLRASSQNNYKQPLQRQMVSTRHIDSGDPNPLMSRT